MVNYKQVQAPGKLTTSRNDFEKHWTGIDFRHEAKNIDTNPILIYAPSLPPHDDSVQGALEALLNLIKLGSDVYSIGDGNQSSGTLTVGADFATIEECFAAALITLRLSSYGGIILLKCGRYNFADTVILPAGISVFGEIGGTIINSTIDKPIFSVEECPGFATDRAPSIEVDGYRCSKFYNLSFFDNFEQNAAVLTSATSCFIEIQQGSNVEIKKCAFFGKYAGTGTSATTTRQAIWVNSASSSSYNTLLNFHNSTILSIQKALTFEIDTTKTNKLIFSNNRAWCSGVIGAAAVEDRNVIYMNGCDAEFCNNDITFGFTSAMNQSIDAFVYCNSAPTLLSTLIMTGNEITAMDTTIVNSNNLFLLPNFPNNGEFLKCVITGNVCPGSNDSNDWYLVVGDGLSTIGDLNGTKALSYIYNYYKQENDFTAQAASHLHGEITIFVKPGLYELDGTDFDTNTSNFAFKLIGLPDGGNLPRILLNLNSPAADGQFIYLGNHIENISFEAAGTYLYYISPTDLFVKPNVGVVGDPAMIRPIYVKNILIKNCYFNNCGINISNSASTTDTNFNGTVCLDNCFFSMAQTLTNATYRTAISVQMPNYNIIIKNCATKDTFYGQILNIEGNSTYKNNDVLVDNCFFVDKGTDVVGDGNIIYFTNIRSLLFENNNINLSSLATGVSSNAIIKVINTDTPTQEQCRAVIKNNFFYGFNTDFIDIAINFFGVQNFDISENIFKDCPMAVFADICNDDSVVLPYEINILNNNYTSNTNSFAFCSIIADYNPPASFPNGNINISNNNIDMTNKSWLCNRYPGAYVYFEATMLGVIFTNVINSTVNIENNNISQYTTGQTVQKEALIGCLQYKSANISNNNTEIANMDTTRYSFSIFASDTLPFYAMVNNSHVVNILNNNITHIGNIVTNVLEYGICAANTVFVNIANNTVRSTGVNNMTNFICAIGSATYSNIGSIINNTLYSDTGDHENAMAISYDSGLASDNIKLTVNRNKGQKFYKDINCYDFRQYGFNTMSEPYPHATATVLANDRADLFSSANAASLNKTQQADILSVISARGLGAWNLDKGLYYTNVYTRALDARCDSAVLGTYKHQILIPVDIDDFVRLVDITIPIYIYNGASSGISTFKVSASLMLCNTIDDATRVECVPGPTGAGPTGIAAWEYRSQTLANPGDSTTVTLEHLTLDAANVWLSPIRKATIAYGPSAQAYIVLAVAGSGSSSNPYTNVYFAIPYARITYTY